MVKCIALFEVRTGFINIVYTGFGFRGLKMSVFLQTALGAETQFAEGLALKS
jgi:hypothetical protein